MCLLGSWSCIATKLALLQCAQVAVAAAFALPHIEQMEVALLHRLGVARSLNMARNFEQKRRLCPLGGVGVGGG